METTDVILLFIGLLLVIILATLRKGLNEVVSGLQEIHKVLGGQRGP